MTAKPMKRRAILAFVQDKPGTLNKISMLIRRKMYNVDTLTVCKAKAPGVSRMTITLREDDEAKVTQVIRQVEKFTEVIRAKELDRDHSYWREVAIVKFELEEAALAKLQQKYPARDPRQPGPRHPHRPDRRPHRPARRLFARPRPRAPDRDRPHRRHRPGEVRRP